MGLRTKFALTGAAICAFLAFDQARADTDLWIDDVAGNIGLVDITNHTVVAGTVHNTGESLTDIGFIGSQMYGTTYTGLFKINDTTGASAAIGSYGGVGNDGMNALVGSGSILLGASNATTEVYSINPVTGAATNFAPTPLPSAGDLAFSKGVLYLSAVNASGANSLVDVNTDSVVGQFSPLLSNVFGLANDGKTTYAVAGTEVYSVNLSDAVLTPLFNYGGLSALGAANGTAFVAENKPVVTIPEPSTWAMSIIGFGLAGALGLSRRKGWLAA